MNMTLGVCLIVKNEEEVLSRCLNCALKFADEIVVVDTGSEDKTVSEAKKFTDKIYFFDWCDDFSAARNFAFSKAESDFVMWLDADDIVEDADCEKIKALIKCADFDAAYLLYASACEGEEPVFFYYRERIFRREKNFLFEGAVHEAVSPSGKLVYSDARILHSKVKENEPFRNLKIYQKQIARGISLNERGKFYYGRELLFNGMYLESAAVLEDFLRGDGWVENKIEACLNLYRAYTALGDGERAQNALLKSLLYAPPRSECCCILGSIFMSNNDVKSAIYWYERAISANNAADKGGFVNADYCGYIPCMQLCVLYDALGETEKACAFNEKAGGIKPHDKSYLYNKNYFRTKLGKKDD